MLINLRGESCDASDRDKIILAIANVSQLILMEVKWSKAAST